jgi:Family of unknown function (DUF6677)
LPDQRPAGAFAACLIGWLIPGAGHLYLGRVGKGIVFLVAIGAMFGLGVAMDARLQTRFGLDDPLSALWSLAQMAVGLPYFLVRYLGPLLAPRLGWVMGDGPIQSPAYEYGNTFTAVGGLLNIMVVLDAFDTALGRKA